MSTLISYQKAYFTKGTSFPGNLATLRFPVTGRIGPVTFVTVGSCNQAFFFLLCLSFLRACGSLHKGFQWTIEAIERVQNADGDEGYRLSVDAEPTSSVEQRNESKVTEAFAHFDRYSIASK